MKVTIPGQNEPISIGNGAVNPIWYQVFKFIETLTPFASDATKSNVIRSNNAQTGTSFTFALTDSGNVCTFNNVAAVSVTVPPNSSVPFDIGAQIDCAQLGAGKVTFVAGSGVTIRSVDSNKAIAARYAAVTLLKIGADEWLLFGALDA